MCLFFLLIFELRVYHGERVFEQHILGLEEDEEEDDRLSPLAEKNSLDGVWGPVKHNPETNLSQVEVYSEEHTNEASMLGWNLFGKTGPKMSDISQGELGDCYYLAGLAAIAREHPEVIAQAFITKGLISRKSGLKVYQLRLLVDGVESIVALDEKVPMAERKGRRSYGRFYFAETNDGHDVWPILLEKAYAKVFGSYLAIRGGWGYDTFKAITQAPVDVYMADNDDSTESPLWPDKNALWNTIDWALKENFPMTAGSVENSFGTVSGHEFAVIGNGWDDKYGATVEVYNPWASNKYNGKLRAKSKRLKGDYSLTFPEFTQAFDMLTVARIRRHHRISYTRIPVGQPVALRFTITTDEQFSVQLEWPTTRFIDVLGCRLERSHVKLLVANENGGLWESGSTAYHGASNLRADMAGKGRYLVYAYGSFNGAPWVEEVAVNVYAAELVTFERLDNPLAVGREILGFPCVDIVKPSSFLKFFDDKYEALPYPVGGSPAWQKTDSDKVIWLSQTGTLTLAPAWDKLSRYYSSFDASKLKCMTSSESQPYMDDRPEPQSEEVADSGCGFKVGDRVSYLHTDHKDRDSWICGEIDAAFAHAVRVRFLRTGHNTVGCDSPKIKRVTQCEWQEEDRIEYLKGGRWVKEQVAEVGCGKVKLSNGAFVACGKGTLRYPGGCPFHKGEKALAWSKRKERWVFVRVSRVVGDRVSIFYGGKELALNCGDTERLKKLSRCDKLSYEQIQRFKKLDNFDEIMDSGRDTLFPPHINSIGPMGADCGDSADGAEPQSCSQFNTWGAISDVLH